MRFNLALPIGRNSFLSLGLLLAISLLLPGVQAQSVNIDPDTDGINNAQDNCINHKNTDQKDGDNDGYGNRCDADFNNDFVVNLVDLNIFAASFLSQDPVVDLNGDGAVNFPDLQIFAELFLTRPGPSGPVASAVAFTTPRVYQNIQMSSPLAMKQAPGQSDRWYVLERNGLIKSFAKEDNTTGFTISLNIVNRVDTFFEGGALGFAFDPNFATNGFLYVSYTADSILGPGPLISRLSRFETSLVNDVYIADPNSEVILLAQNQPSGNHNGGDIAFGADGLMYWGLGDGGGSGDTQGNGQNTSNLLGTIVRLDVDVSESEILQGITYKIPSDNPFAASSGCVTGCPEIFAWGLRNPWRFSFDTVSGDLWAGDVGQNAIEEIDLIVNGSNYGWRCYEGNSPFVAGDCTPGQELASPVYSYAHNLGSSVTGGYVYRGPDFRYDGMYFYGDYSSGRIWGLYEGDSVGQIIDTSYLIASFAQAQSGEIYVVNLSGTIHRLQPVTPPE